MFGLFRKKKQVADIDFSSLRVDMHSHILPGIDDGAQSVKDSLDMARRFRAMGFQKLIATPHIMADYFRNTPERIRKSLDVLRTAFENENIGLEIDAAAEYYLDETLAKKISSKSLLSFGENQVLFELSYINPPNNLEETIMAMRDAGYHPVLAHPERYSYFHNHPENYLRIRELGCALQLNTISLTGYYGKGVKKAAEQLLAEHAIDFLGSDMHHLRHADALKDALQSPLLKQYISDGWLRNSDL